MQLNSKFSLAWNGLEQSHFNAQKQRRFRPRALNNYSLHPPNWYSSIHLKCIIVITRRFQITSGSQKFQFVVVCLSFKNEYCSTVWDNLLWPLRISISVRFNAPSGLLFTNLSTLEKIDSSLTMRKLRKYVKKKGKNVNK